MLDCVHQYCDALFIREEVPLAKWRKTCPKLDLFKETEFAVRRKHMMRVFSWLQRLMCKLDSKNMYRDVCSKIAASKVHLKQISEESQIQS